MWDTFILQPAVRRGIKTHKSTRWVAVQTWIEYTVTAYTLTHTKANNTISKKTKRFGTIPGTILTRVGTSAMCVITPYSTS